MERRPVLVVDYGAQYAELIARRVREAHVYSELVAHTMPVDEMLAKKPLAIIFSGGPASVYEPDAPHIDPKIFDAGVPILGICYGCQLMAEELGGDVDKAAMGEYGKTSVDVSDASYILGGSPAEQTVWMSHGVQINKAPEGFVTLATSPSAPVAAMADPQRKLYGIQWHCEVKHTPLGQNIIENFLHNEAGIEDNWSPKGLMEEVRLHEPYMALDGHEDGLFFYRKILDQAGEHLKPGGLLAFEIGYDQGEEVSSLMKEKGYIQVRTVKDLAGLDRVVTGRKSQEERYV